MPRWDELFDRLRGLEAERLDAERRFREAEAARREREAWAKAALDALWEAVTREVDARAAELARSTGRRVEVVRQQRSGDAVTGLGALRILELRLGASVVYVYSHHANGGEVHVHVAQWPSNEPSRRRQQRMISFPVCTLTRVGERGWKLCRISSGGARRSLTVDDVVYRAFELLVHGLERPDPRVLGLRAVHEPAAGPRSTLRLFPE